MAARKSDVFLGGVAAGCGLLLLMGLDAFVTAHGRKSELKVRQDFVRDYALTDLCLFTEARYTRHPAVADLATPFQDHPFSLEHFPSGSLITPPLWRQHGVD